MHIPIGCTAHVSATEFPATWMTSDPAVASLRSSPTGRHCAIAALAIGECDVTLAANGKTATFRVVVGPEVIGIERLKLVGRDIPA